MKQKNHTPESKRQSAHECAVTANENFEKAKNAHKKGEFWKHKLDIFNKFGLNMHMNLFMIIYVLLLCVDAKIMQPIIEVVVREGLQIDDGFQISLFVLMYIVLVIALTLGIASRLSTIISNKIFEVQAEFEKVSNPNQVLSIIKEDLHKKEKGKVIWSILFGIILAAVVICLSLTRNYLMNEFVIKVDGPDDWINIILPVAIAFALTYFGVYKDLFFKRIEIVLKKNKYDREKNTFQSECNKYDSLAMEQNNFADQYEESTLVSMELAQAIYRYKNMGMSDSDYYDDAKEIKLKLIGNEFQVDGVQVFAITGDDITIHKITNEKGEAAIAWKTATNFIKTLKIGKKVVSGSVWYDKETIEINLDDLNGLKRIPA